ncbi:hypothetical protein D3C80_1383090 [compost metagenome]
MQNRVLHDRLKQQPRNFQLLHRIGNLDAVGEMLYMKLLNFEVALDKLQLFPDGSRQLLDPCRISVIGGQVHSHSHN